MDPLYLYIAGITLATLHQKTRYLKLRGDRMVSGVPPQRQLNFIDTIMAILMIALIAWALFKVYWLWVLGGGIIAMLSGEVLWYVIPPEVGAIGTPLLTMYVWVSNPPW